MLDVSVLLNIAFAILALLAAALAVYFSFRVLGKFAKIVLIILAIVLVLWLIFASGSPLRALLELDTAAHFLKWGGYGV